jgi:type III restriction enzyme
MNKTANEIKNRLSLRKPQWESLEILSEIAEVLELKKNVNLDEAKAKIKELGSKFEEVRKFSNFEREFPNVCFALATGVGKTRLMAAFIIYLHIVKKIHNFFILAPNLTIYNKLKEDFGNPSNPKYVFKGISQFAVSSPKIITGDNYNKTQTNQIEWIQYININIFNVSKINSDVDQRTGLPRIKRLSEYLGESYFDYLKNLPDLVLLMDESHHYRADKGKKVINELSPVLGLELTATPQTEEKSKTVKFKNVVYEYSLAKAMNDGFVKEPAVATRKNFDPKQLSVEALDIMKLEDGIKIHENTKADLDVYSRTNGKKLIKPFVLVVAKDTAHAEWLESHIKSDEFFKGYYKDKVMQIHSAQKGAEKDENITKLLTLEHPNNKIEIVIHVNMLKEGWDVTNLYTIIPLRTATSATLREQTIGRGLRLPYGERTKNPKIDKLTIIAHDKFQEIIEEAQKEGSIIKKENIIEIDEEELAHKKEVITTVSKIEQDFIDEEKRIEQISDIAEKEQAKENLEANKAINNAVFESAKNGKNIAAMSKNEIVEVALKNQIKDIENKTQPGIFDNIEIEKLKKKIEENVEVQVKKIQEAIIEIPRIMIVPADTKVWFEDFDLDCHNLNYQPISEEIKRTTLREMETDIIQSTGTYVNDRLDNIIVNELINIPEVNYDTTSKLLFKLARQVIEKLKTYLNEEEIKNVVQYRKKDILAFIKPQLMEHFKKEITRYEAPDIRGLTPIVKWNTTKYAEDEIYSYKATIEPKSRIKTLLFTGFKKSCHSEYSFDSKTEKDFSIILEDDDQVVRWLRPAPGQFNITWDNNKRNYEPDFVVETSDTIYLVETKKENDITTEEVQQKAKAALEYCHNATEFTTKNNGKPWKYLLLPHNSVLTNYDFSYYAKLYLYNGD